MTQPEKMWDELAQYYDRLYSWKDYETESQQVHQLIQKYQQSQGNSLLEVGCGTGKHIQYLKDHYAITGSDLNPAMLTVARKNHPGVQFIEADMVKFDLNQTFDSITSLFSAIGYVRTLANLGKTLACFARHLKPGGVMLIEPFFTPEGFIPSQKPYASFVDDPEVKIARMNLSQKRGNIAILDFHFLVATSQGVQYLRDKHELGLFAVDKFLALMKKQGLQAQFLKDGLMKDRGLYVGVKPL